MTTGMHDDFDYEAVARYMAGECDAGEAASVEERLARDPAMQRLLDVTRNASDKGVYDVDVTAGLHAVRQRMNVHSLDDARARAQGGQRSSLRSGVPSLLMAASVAVVMLGLITWRAVVHYRTAVPSVDGVYATSTGETRDITLPDGSSVHVGPMSELRVKAGYGKVRDVTIDGLARFSVVHETAHPFIVHAGSATVEDLGTVFSVRTDDQGAVAVVVTLGSVKLRSAGVIADAGVVLGRGDRGRVASSNEVAIAEPGAATAADTAWAGGGLVFENASLERVRSDLKRWYGVAVVTKDSALRSRHLTATFENDSIDQVLHVIGLALDAPVSRHGDTVYIGARH